MGNPELVVRVAANIDALKSSMLDGVHTVDLTQAQLNRLSTGFDGSKIIGQATAMAAAIDAVGGVTTLTAAEMAKANAVFTEAAEKMAKMGDAGATGAAAFKTLAEGTAPVKVGTTEVVSGLENMGVAFEHVAELAASFFGVLTVERLIEFAKGAIESASRIEDLSRATGLSRTEFQQLSYVGKEFGLDAQQMARGVEQLSARLANGDASATKAVEMLGLSVKNLIAAGPKEAFIEVADATGRIADPMLKSALATDEFGGRLAKVLLPALGELREKMEGVPQGALMNDATIESAHRFEIAVDHAKTKVEAFIASVLFAWSGGWTGEIDKATEATDKHTKADVELLTAAQLLQNRLSALRTDALLPLTDAQRSQIAELHSYGESHKEIAPLVGSSEIAVKRYLDSLREQEQAVKKAVAEADKYSAALTEIASVGDNWRGTLNTINGSVVEAIRYYLDAGVSQEKLALAYGLTAAQIKAVVSARTDENETLKKEAAAVLETTKLWDEYSLIVGDRTATAYQKAGAAIDKWAADLTARMQKTGADTAEFYDALAAVVNAKWQNLNVNWAALSKTAATESKQALQETADVAQATYLEALLHVGEWKDSTINAYHDAAVAAQLAADEFGTGYVQNATKAVAAVQGVTAAAQQSAQQMAAAFAMVGGTNSGASAALSQVTADVFGPYGSMPITVELSNQLEQEVARRMAALGYKGAPVGARAEGGPVSAGAPYMVGERGPELFVPSSSGSIVPNGGAAGGVSVHVTINGSVLGNKDEIARVVGDAFMSRLRALGTRLPSGA